MNAPLKYWIRAWCGRLDPPSVRSVRCFYATAKNSDAPEIRGRRLLRRWLSREQLAQYDAFRFFDVVGCHTARRYRIYYALSANVDLLNEFGAPEERFCFVPQGYLVPGDVMLAQKIALETDELAALAVANRLAPSAGFVPNPC